MFISRLQKKLLLPLRRSEFRDIDFCIVSNNCWGAHIYSELGKPYLTPFVGLFLMPACYLNLVENFPDLLFRPLVFKENSKYESSNFYRAEKRHHYPIAELTPEVEIHFLHYKSEQEARDKWSRRLARIPPLTDRDKFFFKLCDHDGLSPEQLTRFLALPFKNKVCFTASAWGDCPGVVKVRECRGAAVPDGLGLAHISNKYFDTLDWLRGGDGTPSLASIL